MTRIERFWLGVAVSDHCWEHRNALGSHGYPQFGGTTAHRESWKIHNGTIPLGVMVLHTCNNKRCVKPEHLRLGDHKENMNDLSTVGHSRRSLTREQVLEVRSSVEPQRVIARRLGVDQRVVWNARAGRTYRYVR